MSRLRSARTPAPSAAAAWAVVWVVAVALLAAGCSSPSPTPVRSQAGDRTGATSTTAGPAPALASPPAPGLAADTGAGTGVRDVPETTADAAAPGAPPLTAPPAAPPAAAPAAPPAAAPVAPPSQAPPSPPPDPGDAARWGAPEAPGASSASDVAVLTPLDFGAVGDGTTDDTAALQRALDDLRAGRVLVLPAGRTFAHGSLLRVRHAGATITGGGTLRSTNPASSTLWVEADRVTVSGITLTSEATSRGGTWDDTKLLVKGSTGVTVEGVTVRGSRSAGIFVDSSADFTLRDVTVEDTRADGIHITRGSRNGTVERATVRRTGDDGIAVVSYRADPVVHRVSIRSPRVEGTVWGRGLSVVGGRDIAISDVHVEASDAAGLFVASEAGWNTHDTVGVTIDRGTLVGANKSATVDHGAILVLSEAPDRVVANVRISDVTVRDTHPRASRETGVLGGATGVEMSRISVVGGGSRSMFVTNSPHARFTLRGWAKDGHPVADRGQ